MRVWKAGERCRLTVHRGTERECSVIAEVAIASSNGLSLFVTFEAIVNGHTGGMPLLWVPDRECFVSFIDGVVATLTELGPELRSAD